MKRLHLQIELNDYCNADCIMCCIKAHDTGFRNKIGHGNMDTNTVLKLIKEFRDIKADIKEITIPWAGEPTIHPDFPIIIRILLEQDFCHVNLVTNGIAMNEELIDIILKYSVHRTHKFNILFSIDAATKDTYKNIKKTDNFDKLIKQIDKLISKREIATMKFPTLLLQFILMEENKEELEDFKILCKELFKTINYYESNNNNKINTDKDGYNIRLLGWHGDSKTKSIEELAKLNSIIIHPDNKIDNSLPCSMVFENLNFHWSGVAVPCCNDLGIRNSLGVFPQNSLEEILNSSTRKWFQKKHLSGKRNEINLCKNCCVFQEYKF